ncbi:VanZ family protein [Candidatus Enterococcus murrayae]
MILDILFRLYLIACIFLPCLIYQAFILKRKEETIFISSMVWRWVFLLYLYLVINVTGVGTLEDILSYPDLTRPEEINLSSFQTGVGMLNVLNIIMFTPLGFLLPLIWKQCRRLGFVVLLGCEFSLMIEFLQLFNRRATDIDDLLMNTLGAFIGFFLWKLSKKIIHRAPKEIQVFPRQEPQIYLFLSLTGVFFLYHWRYFLRLVS